ncbi:MAG TPA: MFS transporter [Myxococcales bacterium]|jgi:MFS family permease
MSEESSVAAAAPEERPNPLKEITQPFVDLVKAPRALWGVNLAYMLEGLCYFGVLGYLEIHFSDYIFAGVPHPEVWAHNMVGVLTAGIALSMAVLGFVPDKWGVRKALLLAFVLLVGGRVFISLAPALFGAEPRVVGSALHLMTMGGIVLVLFGYGMYQPAAYSAVRQFTTPKTAAMAYAMLYALMNAGSALLMAAFVLRDEKFLNLGITGTFWVFTALTVVSLIVTATLLSRKTVDQAIATAKAETAAIAAAEKKRAELELEKKGEVQAAKPAVTGVPVTAWITLVSIVVAIVVKVPSPWSYIVGGLVALVPVIIALLPKEPKAKAVEYIATHPLADTKFFVFIFALIPVQTLFTYNWLILPQYISRAYDGWIGEYYEFFSNLNPILIFIIVPVATALTYKKKIYSMMLIGTTVMASSAFVLAFGANVVTLSIYIVLMTVGEALWQPRFLQYATEIAPEGKAGLYQGVAQLPWFLTKALVPLLYSGQMMAKYVPATGPKDSETMWFIFGLIAIASPISLVLLKGWLGKDFKTKAA